MKFTTLGRNLMTAGVSAALAFGTVACSRDYVAAYVYSTSAANGNVSGFAVDYQSGILNQISGSPFASNFTNPTSSIASPNGKTLYIIGDSRDAAVEPASIGTDGKLYMGTAVNMPGNATYPNGAAMDSTGNFLYVTYLYQNGFGPSSSGPGGVALFALNGSTGAIGSTTNFPLVTPDATTYSATVSPVAVTVTVPSSTQGNAVFVYVVAQATNIRTGQPVGLVYEFTQNTSTGVITQTGVVPATVNPSAIISEPTGRFVYISDKNSNQIVGEQILNNNGGLQALSTSPYATGLFPVQMTIDPRGKFLYAVNYNSSTVSGYVIDHGDGHLTAIVGASNFATATNPTCVTVDPSVGIYLYTSNYTDHSISGAQLKSEDGTLTAVANTPFPVSSLPSCVTSVANGSHALSLVFPN